MFLLRYEGKCSIKWIIIFTALILHTVLKSIIKILTLWIISQQIHPNFLCDFCRLRFFKWPELTSLGIVYLETARLPLNNVAELHHVATKFHLRYVNSVKNSDNIVTQYPAQTLTFPGLSWPNSTIVPINLAIQSNNNFVAEFGFVYKIIILVDIFHHIFGEFNAADTIIL